MGKFGRKGLNPLSKKASGVEFDPTINVTYRGSMYPELQGQKFSVPKFGGSGKRQREWIEQRHKLTIRERQEAEDARTAAKEAREELAATRAALKQLQTQVVRLRRDVEASIQVVLIAAGVDRKRAQMALTQGSTPTMHPARFPHCSRPMRSQAGWARWSVKNIVRETERLIQDTCNAFLPMPSGCPMGFMRCCLRATPTMPRCSFQSCWY